MSRYGPGHDIAGGIASLIVPGRTPGGTVGALIVGVVGGLAGGWLVHDVLDLGIGGGIVGSTVIAIVGAVLILVAMRKARERF